MDRLLAACLGVSSFFWIELTSFDPSSQDKTIFKLAGSLIEEEMPPKGRSVRHSCQPDLMFTKNPRLLGLLHSLENNCFDICIGW